MKDKHIPLRLCIVCKALRAKKDLIRMAYFRKGNIEFDANNRLTGKGIYLCPQVGCLSHFLYEKKFRKRFHPKMDDDSLIEITKLLGSLKD